MAPVRKPPSTAAKLDSNIARRFQRRVKAVQHENDTTNLTVSLPTMLAFLRNMSVDSTYVGRGKTARSKAEDGSGRDDEVRQRHAVKVYNAIQADPDPDGAKIELGKRLARRVPGYTVEVIDHISHTDRIPEQPSYAFKVTKIAKR